MIRNMTAILKDRDDDSIIYLDGLAILDPIQTRSKPAT